MVAGFAELAEERLARHFRVLAPDLRGHGRSSYEPPWDIATHLGDIVETIEVSASSGPSVGLQLRRPPGAPPRRPGAGAPEGGCLLDPAIQILPHVGHDFAQEAALDHSFATVEEAIEIAPRQRGAHTEVASVEEEAEEHLESSPDGSAALAVLPLGGRRRPTASSARTRLRRRVMRVLTLLVHATQFGLVRAEQLDEYASSSNEHVEVTGVPGGHIVYWDAYEETADAVEKFLLRHSDVSHA